MDISPYKNTGITLAIETSGRIGSVAIGRGNELLAQTTFSGFMKHSTELFPHIQGLLDGIGARPADIVQLFITAGPGSFTGLRIAVTVAKMMDFAHQTQIVAVDSMDVLAENMALYNAESENPIDCVATILDAKRNLFFAGVFEREDDDWKKIIGTELIGAEALMGRLEKEKKGTVAFLGEGLVYYADQFKSPFSVILDEKYWPATASGLYRAGLKMARQGKFADPNTLAPFYVRRPEAVENWEKRQKNT